MKISILLSMLLLASVAGFSQKSTNEIPKNWHQLDKDSTGYYGISLNKAYNFLKAKKVKSKQCTQQPCKPGCKPAPCCKKATCSKA